MVNYELVDETNGMRYSHSWWRIIALILLCTCTFSVVFHSWNLAYDAHLMYPPCLSTVPDWWYRRAHIYANSALGAIDMSHDFRLIQKQIQRARSQSNNSEVVTEPPDATDITNETNMVNMALPTPTRAPDDSPRLVCYYSIPMSNKKFDDLRLGSVNAHLCTHINIGMVDVRNSTLCLTEELKQMLRSDVAGLHEQNPDLKLLLWVGGGDTSFGFPAMVKDHANRKRFIQSLKEALIEFNLDGVDLDWEFPSAYNKERQHFSQLLYEIKQEYKRERKDYLLTVAVAAPEGIALFAYDVGEINKYADFANLMSYDYHFYTKGTPFTGLNAPLYKRFYERSILGTLNINYSVHWWLANGLDKKKLVVGLPTYGHSFTLVNPFNNVIGAPAETIGACGSKGFSTYSEICWFNSHNFIVNVFYDQETCSPYLSSGTEWISFENEMSMECKTRYVKSLGLGGVMIFSLNTDDFNQFCRNRKRWHPERYRNSTNASFPLVETVKRVLVDHDEKIDWHKVREYLNNSRIISMLKP